MGGFKRITIMGLGLMGGSMALGLKQRRFQGEIIGWDHSLDTLEQAKSSGAVDRVYAEPWDAVKETELVILATRWGPTVKSWKRPHPSSEEGDCHRCGQCERLCEKGDGQSAAKGHRFYRRTSHGRVGKSRIHCGRP